jgi:hypothetical protein
MKTITNEFVTARRLSISRRTSTPVSSAKQAGITIHRCARHRRLRRTKKSRLVGVPVASN